ncbi:MAG: hypothetical protein ACRDPA_26130 [Solirubrobacteraceae bacterium]
MLRWSRRVGFYSYSALGTEHDPPFTLEDVADYPARRAVDYPRGTSRGLALVKWWLPAIPPELIVAVFTGTGWTAWGEGHEWAFFSLGGLNGLMVLIAAVLLLFTARHPKPAYDFVLGMNRWVYRVAAALLMTDRYAPFRLDMGGEEPAPERFAETTIPPAGSPLPS